ncbi:MerR family transcriptional regulator [Lactobacillus sp. ESL0681]|nr:MerR family transcriptional regulator [Lactobacillus sp. ESL0681]WEV39781.1 MerR family transcriptional regulator [Lactobacillus sp. ESL0681]
MKLTVKQAAEKLNMSEHTIRFYTNKGLVPAVERDQNNHRLFNQEALNWLEGDNYLRKTGMSLTEVKHYVDLCITGEKTIPERYQIIKAQMAKTQQQLADIQKQIAFLKHKEEIYQTALTNTAKDYLNPKTWNRE